MNWTMEVLNLFTESNQMSTDIRQQSYLCTVNNKSHKIKHDLLIRNIYTIQETALSS